MLVVCHGHWPLWVVALHGKGLDHIRTAIGIPTLPREELNPRNPRFYFLGQGSMNLCSEQFPVINRAVHWDTMRLKDSPNSAGLMPCMDVHRRVTESRNNITK